MPANDVSKPRVLIADDHEPTRRLLASLLEGEFDVVATVGDGGEAVAETVHQKPDVAVLDIAMPILDGLSVLKRLREMGENVPVVFVTVFEDLDLTLECLASSALGYVLKSCVAADLCVAIRNAIAGHRFVSPCLRIDDGL